MKKNLPSLSPIAGFLLAIAAIVFANETPALATSIDWITIGDAGNADDTYGDGYGGVAYEYRLSKHEVTNAQYVEFLNDVAASDPYALYNTYMGSSTYGGIVRSGGPGSYTYAVKSDAVGQGPGGSNYTFADKPIHLVSWYDTLRFSNWLTSGTTESGTYTITGGGPNSGSVSFPDHAILGPGHVFLPTEDEWYKAAYYDGNNDTYYEFPTGTNVAPNNNVPSADTGNSANFDYATGDHSYPLTDVGAYNASSSPYGTFDQGGNVIEWVVRSASSHGLRGGFFGSPDWHLSTNSYTAIGNPAAESGIRGFRVASSLPGAAVPEPSTYAMAVFALVGLGGVTRRRKRMVVRAAAILVCGVMLNSATPSHAITIFTNGLQTSEQPTGHYSGHNGYQVYDNFSVDRDDTLRSVRDWQIGVHDKIAVNPGSFTFRIHEGDAMDIESLSEPIYEQFVEVGDYTSAIDTVLMGHANRSCAACFRVSFDLRFGLPLVGGRDYAFTMYDHDQRFRWMNVGSGDGFNHVRFGTDDNFWEDSNTPITFDNQFLDGGPTVPEPSTYAMAAFALTRLGLFARRRRQQ